MRKIILLFSSYICMHSLTKNLTEEITNKRIRDNSDESVILNQKEFEEDQKNTISSFETKLQLKAQAFYEELLEDQPIATQLKTLITDLIYYQDILIKTNYSYNYLLIYDQIIHFLKKINHLSLSETSLRNLSMNDAPSLSSPKNKSQITNNELMKIFEKTLKNKDGLNTINFAKPNTKYSEILKKTPLDRFKCIIEVAENQEFQIENDNNEKLQLLRKKERKNTLLRSEIEEYKLLKNLEYNKKIRTKNSNQNVSQESILLNNAKKRLIYKMQKPEFKEATPKKLKKNSYFFMIPNTNLRQEILEFNKFADKLKIKSINNSPQKI